MNLPLLLGAFFGLTAVAAAALTNHRIDPDDVEKVMLAVRSQQLHAIVLVIFGFAAYLPLPSGLQRKINISTFLFTLGILLFSGVIYLKYFVGLSTIGFLVPFGGVTIMLAWLVLIWAGIVSRIKSSN